MTATSGLICFEFEFKFGFDFFLRAFLKVAAGFLSFVAARLRPFGVGSLQLGQHNTSAEVSP
jgi:hypothetical protein